MERPRPAAGRNLPMIVTGGPRPGVPPGPRWGLDFVAVPGRVLTCAVVDGVSPVPGCRGRMREWRNGRRARFRSVCPKGRGGSTPPSRTLVTGPGPSIRGRVLVPPSLTEVTDQAAERSRRHAWVPSTVNRHERDDPEGQSRGRRRHRGLRCGGGSGALRTHLGPASSAGAVGLVDARTHGASRGSRPSPRCYYGSGRHCGRVPDRRTGWRAGHLEAVPRTGVSRPVSRRRPAPRRYRCAPGTCRSCRCRALRWELECGQVLRARGVRGDPDRSDAAGPVARHRDRVATAAARVTRGLSVGSRSEGTVTCRPRPTAHVGWCERMDLGPGHRCSKMDS